MMTMSAFAGGGAGVIFIRWRVAPARRAGSIKSWSRLVADVAAFFLAVTMELGRSGRSMMTMSAFAGGGAGVIFIRWRVAPARRAGSIKSWSRLVADVAAFFLAVRWSSGGRGDR